MNTTTQHRRTTHRARMSAAERQLMQDAALDRAQHGRTCANDLLIIEAFAARGIDAHPREDCYTYNAWKALGRHVRKGEHGVHVPVYVHVQEPDKDQPDKLTDRTIPTGATVFHISQTDPDEPTPAPIRRPAENIRAEQADEERRDQAEEDREQELLKREQDDERAYSN